MEQTSRLDESLEYPCGICNDTFPANELIKHLTGHIEIADGKHTHYLWCQLCSPLLRRSNVHDTNGMKYSNGMGMAGNSCIPDDNFVDEQITHSPERDIYEPVPFTYFCDNSVLYTSHEDDFYCGTNSSKSSNISRHSVGKNNYDATIHKGTTYFSLLETPNGVTAEQVSHVESQLGAPNAAIPNIAAYPENCLGAPNAAIPNIEDIRNAEQPGATKVEIIPENMHVHVDVTESAMCEPLLESTNAHFQPNEQNSNLHRIGKNPSPTGSLNFNIGDGQSVGNRSNENYDSHQNGKSANGSGDNRRGQNVKNRNVYSNANNRPNKKAGKHKSGKYNSHRGGHNGNSCTTSRDNSHRGGHNGNSCTTSRDNSHQDGHNGSSCTTSRDNSHQDGHNGSSCTTSRDNSHQDGQRSSVYNDSYNTNCCNNQSGSNDGFKNVNSQRSDQISRGDGQSYKGHNDTYNAHCYENESDDKRRTEISGVSSEVSKDNSSYSAAVKRSL